MAAKPNRPEPMNVTAHHPKVNVSLSLSDPLFVAGNAITGKMEMDCKADKGLGIGVMMVELFAIQDLTSRDHHATSAFIHSRRVFQGPGYTPSNAVQPHPMPGDPQLPTGYYTARKGHSTFLFKFPVPETSPNSISFGDSIATIRYEVRASVGVSWKGERKFLVDKTEVDVVECFDEQAFNSPDRPDPQGVVVAENGKIWAQARLVGGLLVAGESACVELQVKNHSTKKNSSLQIGLSRHLVLPKLSSGETSPNTLQITDTLTTVPFKGPEYIIPPGVEGVASLVFDVPKSVRGAKGGMYDGDSEFDQTPGQRKQTQSLFGVQCVLGIKLVMGLGSKDILVEVPVSVVHPTALPALPPPEPYYDYGYQPQHPHAHNPYATPPLSHTPHPHGHYVPPPAMSPHPNLYYNHPTAISPAPQLPVSPAPYSIDPVTGLVWLPPPGSLPDMGSYYPQPYHADPYQDEQQHLYQPWAVPQRPSSAGPGGGRESTRPLPIAPVASGLPPSSVNDVREVSSSPTTSFEKRERKQSAQLSLHNESSSPTSMSNYPGQLAEVGTGLRASRIANHLRVTSTVKGRGRSASPVGMRYRPEDALHQQQLQLLPESDQPAYAVATIHGNMSKALHILLPPPDVGPAALSPPLHSPRPMLSPKQSYTNLKDGGVGVKSEKVAELERMADEVGERANDLSGDLPKAENTKVEKEVDVNKTLPKPQPQVSPLLKSGPDNDYFGNAVVDPATPTTRFGNARLGFGLGKRESGLDVLEKKLLAQVGTRKVENEKRPDVWSVLGVDQTESKKEEETKKEKRVSPIDIPAPRQGPVDPLNDSAISSLTLPDCGVGAGTSSGGVGGGALEKELLELESARVKNQEREGGKREKRRTRRAGSDDDSDAKTSVGKSLSGRTERQKKKDKEGEGSGITESTEKKERRSGHGRKKNKVTNARVAAWLGDVKSEVATPPAEDHIVHTPSPVPTPLEDSSHAPTKEEPRNDPPLNRSRLPDPRSSGFVPIGTLKPDIYQRTLVPKDSPFASSNNMEEDARKITEIWSKDNKDNQKASPASPQVSGITNPWQSVRSPIFAKNVNRLPVFPLAKGQSDPEVKYDIRSARGGRGGKVTAVAAMWAAVADSKETAEIFSKPSSESTSSSTPKRLKSPTGLAASRPKPLGAFSPANPANPMPISASSSSSSASSRSKPPPKTNGIHRKFGVGAAGLKASPAVLSYSSHAIPMLSSTASLAKSPATQERKQSLPLPARVPHTISEMVKEAPSKRLSMPALSKPSRPSAGAISNLKALVEEEGPGKGSDSPSAKPPIATELAFGQARLRDLIKKYQGQSS